MGWREVLTWVGRKIYDIYNTTLSRLANVRGFETCRSAEGALLQLGLDLSEESNDGLSVGLRILLDWAGSPVLENKYR